MWSAGKEESATVETQQKFSRPTKGERRLTVNDRINLDGDIIASDDRLSRDGSNLDLDIDDSNLFRVGVDLDQSRVDRLVELTESADESDTTLRDGPGSVKTVSDRAGVGKITLRLAKRDAEEPPLGDTTEDEEGTHLYGLGQQKQQGIDPNNPATLPRQVIMDPYAPLSTLSRARVWA